MAVMDGVTKLVNHHISDFGCGQEEQGGIKAERSPGRVASPPAFLRPYLNPGRAPSAFKADSLQPREQYPLALIPQPLLQQVAA